MAVVFTVRSLEEICFAYILKTLEEYAAAYLALLPKEFQNRLLHSLPVVDICQLEGTEFTSGFNMESFWEEFYKDHIDPRPYRSKQSWRDKLFATLSSTILKDDRPYGYFQVMSRAKKRTPWVGSDMTEDRPIHEHPVDKVNYLVSTKHESSQIDEDQEKKVDEDKDEDEHYAHMRQRYGPVNVTMKRHEVTLKKGRVPPGSVYHKACRSKQLVPPRYANLFPEGSCFLPDSSLLARSATSTPKKSTFLFLNSVPSSTVLSMTLISWWSSSKKWSPCLSMASYRMT